MKNLNDSVLTLVARASDRLGPVSRMLDSLMDRVITVQTAKACGGYPCSWICYDATCQFNQRIALVTYGVVPGCYFGPTCTIGVCGFSGC